MNATIFHLAITIVVFVFCVVTFMFIKDPALQEVAKGAVLLVIGHWGGYFQPSPVQQKVTEER